MNAETTEDYSWVPLVDEKTISITYLNIKMQSERWSHKIINIFRVENIHSHFAFQSGFFASAYLSNPGYIKVDSAFIKRKSVMNGGHFNEASISLVWMKNKKDIFRSKMHLYLFY